MNLIQCCTSADRPNLSKKKSKSAKKGGTFLFISLRLMISTLVDENQTRLTPEITRDPFPIAKHHFFYFLLLTANAESLSANSVKTYLAEHPEFLDIYIQENIHVNTIEQWISKKSPKISSTACPSSTARVSSPSNSLSTSITIKPSSISKNNLSPC